MDGFESQIEEEQKAKRSEIKSTEARRRGDRSFWDRYPESILSRMVRSLIIHLQTHFPHFREIILQPYWIKESVASSYTVL